MIKLAVYNDLNDIMDIVSKTVCIMESEGNPQWNEKYPIINDFARDIDKNSLFVYLNFENKPIAFICIDNTSTPEYS